MYTTVSLFGLYLTSVKRWEDEEEGNCKCVFAAQKSSVL